MEFQQQEQVKSDQIRKQLLIPQEKVIVIVKFKPPTFVLPPSKDIVPSKNNYSISSISNLGSTSFLSKKNLFSLSKTTPTYLEKRDFFTLPFLFLLSLSKPAQPSPPLRTTPPMPMTTALPLPDCKPVVEDLCSTIEDYCFHRQRWRCCGDRCPLFYC